MMASYLQIFLGSLLFVSALNFLLVHAENSCPYEEEISPCICTNIPFTRLTCHNINDISLIKETFKNAEWYIYREVYIISSSLLYLPSEIFNKKRVDSLFVINTTLDTLFDKAPRSVAFSRLHLDASDTQREYLFNSGLLRNFTRLDEISVKRSNVDRISSDFSKNLPNIMRKISFNDTGIRNIEPGALDGLNNLRYFAVQFSKISNLTRDMFPRPFNVESLIFDYNNINFITEDVFTEMPRLKFLSMFHNYISVIPEAAFGGSTGVNYMWFEGNPLECNCSLLWLIREKSRRISGTCYIPSRLQGKHLQDLVPGDFNC